MADAPLDAGFDHFTVIEVAVPLACTARGADGPPATAPADDTSSVDINSDASATARKFLWRQTFRFMHRLLC
jgi:hypothetical protein